MFKISNKYPLLVFIYLQEIKNEELTDAQLFNLSQRFTKEIDLNRLGINSLGVEDYVIDGCIMKSNRDIQIAAHNVLKHWRKAQTDTREVYQKLCKVMIKVNMGKFMAETLM